MNWQRAHTQSYYRLDAPDGCNLHDLSDRLIVNCSGVSVIDSAFRSHVPNGRHDYYLMLLIRGSLNAMSGEKEFMLSEGDLIIYPPDVAYGYRKDSEERMIYLWAHFTGSEAEKALLARSLQPGCVCHVRDTELLEADFEAIQRLFITRPAFFLEEAALQMELLLTHAARLLSASREEDPLDRIQASLNHLNRHYAEPLRLETLASMEYLSPSRYSALFRRMTGRSPQQYLIELRLKNARELLLSTNLSVAEVARSVGYDDALYFSRLFRRHFGFSPSTLRVERRRI